MSTQRLAKNQLLTDVPLETAREQCWRVLVKDGQTGVVIDREKNVVVGSKSAGLTRNGEMVTVKFDEQSSGIAVTINARVLMGGSERYGKLKRRAKKITDAIEKSLNSGLAPNMTPAVEMVAAPLPVGTMAPIAAPTGGSSYIAPSDPIYGVALPPKRGAALLTYGIVGLLCCQILAPATWIYSNRALKEYGDYDPGDKGQIKIARVLGILGTLLIIIRVGFLFRYGQ